ncbi:MAG: molybdenum cofactor guanylyltransferase [Alphaproteobacteria bacterium]
MDNQEDKLTSRPAIAGLVLAGGRSSRFGKPKAHAMLDGVSLMTHVARSLRNHIGALAVAGDACGPELNATALVDPPDIARGPLAGVLAGLDWATHGGFDWIATAPCDAPLIPGDMVPRLFDAATSSGARVVLAATSDGWHPLCALWRTDLAGELRAALASGRHPSVHGFAESVGVSIVQFEDAEAFLNINTPEDFARAQAIRTRRRS